MFIRPLLLICCLLSWHVSLEAQQTRPSSRPARQSDLEAQLRARTQTDSSVIDLDLIMLGQDYCGTEPSRPRFTVDGKSFLFRWRKDKPKTSRFLVDLATLSLRELEEDADAPMTMDMAVISNDSKWAAYSRRRRLFLLNRSTHEEVVLIDDGERRSILGFTANNKGVIFKKDNSLATIDRETRFIHEFARVSKANTKSSDAVNKNKQRRYIEEAELGLLRTVFEEAEAERKRKAKKKTRPDDVIRCEYPAEFELGRLVVANNMKTVILGLVRRKPGKKTSVPRYITQSGYVEDSQSRPKVGDSDFSSSLYLVSAKTGKGMLLELPNWTKTYSIRTGIYSPDAKRAAFVARSRDNKDAGIFLLDTGTGKVREVHHVLDEAWVRHVGDDMGFLPDNRLWFTSEKTGFNHLYCEDGVGKEIIAMTEGNWFVASVQTNDKQAAFFLTTSRKSPHTRRLEQLSYAGGASTEIVSAPGWNSAWVSPSGQQIVNIHSHSNRPPELFVRQLEGPASEVGKRITDSPTKAFKAHSWYQPKIHYFEASDGVKVPMRLYLPSGNIESAPAVVFVHGAGYLQNVVDGWSPYYREYMFHNFLRERGFVVADVDYRGSAGYGRDWRTAIYRHMGARDLDDQVDATKFLVKEHGVDAQRIGIYGGSYGGFITLMAMFTRPGVFRSGAALRPVTDWAHYNHGYTANILNIPSDDPEAFERSSPIHFADGLIGRLLICHGLVDGNVQVQDTFRLAQRLIELRLVNWEVALYPVEPHGFRDSASWADEYKRIFKMFEETLR